MLLVVDVGNAFGTPTRGILRTSLEQRKIQQRMTFRAGSERHMHHSVTFKLSDDQKLKEEEKEKLEEAIQQSLTKNKTGERSDLIDLVLEIRKRARDKVLEEKRKERGDIEAAKEEELQQIEQQIKFLEQFQVKANEVIEADEEISKIQVEIRRLEKKLSEGKVKEIVNAETDENQIDEQLKQLKEEILRMVCALSCLAFSFRFS